MPRPASELEECSYLRLLVMGGPKVGKSTTCAITAPGMGYVINCDDPYSLGPLARLLKERGTDPNSKFDWDFCGGKGVFGDLEKAIHAARKGAESGRYQWVMLDTLTFLSQHFEDILLADDPATGKPPDGRRAWDLYNKRVRSTIGRLVALPCHVIVTSHYVDVAGAITDTQVEKTGKGIVPGLRGASRATVAGQFQDVVFLEKRNGKRVFVCNDEGVFGPGCRSNLDGVSVVDADIGALWERFRKLPGPSGAVAGK